MARRKSAVDEVRRLATTYARAIAQEGRSGAGLLPGAWNLMLARVRYRVGPRFFSLFEFTRRPRSTWRDYLTDDPTFQQMLVDMSTAEARAIADDKALFHVHCREHGLPTIPIVCLMAPDTVRAYPGLVRVTTRDLWHAAMAGAPTAMFVKPLGGAHGWRAFPVERSGSEVSFEGRTGTLDDLYDDLLAGLDEERAWIVQARARDHARLARLSGSSALSTVRVLTCLDAGTPRLLYAVLKIPVGASTTDNWQASASGNCIAAVDVERGTLERARRSTRRDWPALEDRSEHPVTGERIEGFALPGWEALVDVVLRAQASLPGLRSCGWDVALTDEGPLLVEANVRYGMSIMQVSHRRGMRHELARHLGVHPDACGP
jgi:hypothetical protein